MNLFEQIQELDFPAPLPATLLEIEQQFEAPQENNVAGASRAPCKKAVYWPKCGQAPA